MSKPFKVAELIEVLRALPQDLDVYFDGSEWTHAVCRADVTAAQRRVFFPDGNHGDFVMLSEREPDEPTPKRSAE